MVLFVFFDLPGYKVVPTLLPEREGGVQLVELAETVAEETEVQEAAEPVSYLTPTLETGQLVEFQEGTTVEHHFVAREVEENE